MRRWCSRISARSVITISVVSGWVRCNKKKTFRGTLHRALDESYLRSMARKKTSRESKNALMARLAQAEAELARIRARETLPVLGPRDAAASIREACHEEQETFVVLLMNARMRPLATRVVGLGTLAQVDVHPREVFREAVRMSAHAIVVGHNHPSGDPEPSSADIELTERLVAAGKILGIPVLDHVIVTDTQSVSLASRGLCSS